MRIVMLALLLLMVPHPVAAADLGDLHSAMRRACRCAVDRIEGNPSDRKTWLVHYGAGVTAEQRAAGNAVVAVFDMTATPAPAAITRLQAKMIMARAGLLPAVEKWIASQDDETQLIWREMVNVHRDSDLMRRIGVALKLTAAQVDALFVAAAQL